MKKLIAALLLVVSAFASAEIVTVPIPGAPGLNVTVGTGANAVAPLQALHGASEQAATANMNSPEFNIFGSIYIFTITLFMVRTCAKRECFRILDFGCFN